MKWYKNNYLQVCFSCIGGILVHVLASSAVELGFSLNSVKLRILIWVFSPFPLITQY